MRSNNLLQLVDQILALIGTPREQAPWGVKCSHKDLCYGKKFSPMLLSALEKFVVDAIEAKRAYNDDFSRRRKYLPACTITLKPCRIDPFPHLISPYA
jgi:hypothetical protein